MQFFQAQGRTVLRGTRHHYALHIASHDPTAEHKIHDVCDPGLNLETEDAGQARIPKPVTDSEGPQFPVVRLRPVLQFLAR
jgi:hypothetical protein